VKDLSRFPARSGVLQKASFAAVLISFFTAWQVPAFGHMRWFVDQHTAFPEQHYTMDLTNWLVLVGAVLFAILACVIHRKARSSKIYVQLEGAAQIYEKAGWRLVAALAGIMLILNTLMKIYLAPNLSLTGEGITWFGLIAQGLVGVLLLAQITFTISGIMIYVAAALAAFFNAPELMIDYVFEFGALGFSLILVGPRLSGLDRKVFQAVKVDPKPYENLPVPIIRIGVGITLIILATHNKLLNPAMSVAFLEQFNLNFMPYLGFEGFTKLHYAFAAGIAELTIGILVLFGIATRFVIVVLAGFFVSTLIILAPLELIGHLPLFGIAFLLILCGSGSLRAKHMPPEGMG
jgi:uncharacterized membrane protein YphA (DoxX/SURF4 family)